MSSCRYFIIRNQTSQLFLEVSGSAISSGAPLTLGKESKPMRDSQLFWQDNVTGTIRTKSNDMCIDVYGDVAVVGSYVNGNPNQQWVIAGSRIQNRINPGWVLMQEKTDSQSNYSQKVTAGIYTFGSTTQHWTVDIPHPEFFRIKNQKTGLYLVQHGIGQVALVESCKCQQLTSAGLWYEHYNGALLSQSNDFVLSSRGEEMFLESSKRLSHLNEHWFRRGDDVVWSADNGVVLEASPTPFKGHCACARNRGLSETQKWTFETPKPQGEVVT